MTLVVAALGFLAAFLVTWAKLSSYGLVPDLTASESWRVFAGTGYCLAAAAVFSLAVGSLVRSTAAAVTTSLVVLLLLPTTLAFVNLDWVQTAVGYLPLPASSAFLTGGDPVMEGAHQLTATQGLVAVTLWAVIPLAAAVAAMLRRDA